MTLWFRLLWLVLRTPFRSSIALNDVSRLHSRVWPSDLDMNIHMNNGKYLGLMDLGRLDFVFRCGLLGYMLRHKARPVIGGATLQWKRPLSPFRRFTQETRLVGWDDKWFYMSQHFVMADGRTAATAVVRGLFVSPKGRIMPHEMLSAMGFETTSPALPEWTGAWAPVDAGLERADASA